jgi:natural product biosynthesis luciferase-like monooxygenase protein
MSIDAARLRSLTPSQKRRLLQGALATRQPAPTASTTATAAGPHRWMVTLAARPAARRRVICFPHGAGGPAAFRDWPDLLPPDLEPLAVQLPGREARTDEPATTSLDTAVTAIVDALAPVLDRPYVLYGQSLGGAIAYASAVEIVARGLRRPDALVVASAVPPGHAFGPPAGASDDEYLRYAAGTDMYRYATDMQARSALLQRAGADRALLSDWPARRTTALDMPITAIAGRDDETLKPSALAAWSQCTTGAFELRVVPGPHLFPLTDPAGIVEIVSHASGSRPARSVLGQPVHRPPRRAGLGLSLFFFSQAEAADDPDKYALFDAAVQFADRSGFDAVWMPERHFHPVGGLFPNPSVLAAGVAASTRRLRIRSGSVVLPMHDPVRVAEEWSVVDNLSGGRVDLGVVPGWNPNDYALAPEAYASRWRVLFEHLDVVRRLWRGESIARVNGASEEVQVRLHPRPMQPELPVWIATSANDASFTRAGELGLNVLTALLIQPVEAFARRVALYRQVRARYGHDPDAGTVTLMVQACVGGSDDEVRRIVRDPFIAYMHSVQSLWKDTVGSLRMDSAADQDRLVEMVFERYFQKSTLFGGLDTCVERAGEFARAGATEIACMVDFGLSYEQTMVNLGWIDRLREALAAPSLRPTPPCS